MNPVRKRLKLTPSKVQKAICSIATTPSKLISHDALSMSSQTPSPAFKDARPDEEQDEGYLVVEEDTTDSSLVIIMEENPLKVKDKRNKPAKRKRKKKTVNEGSDAVKGKSPESEEEGETAVEVEIDKKLDQALETKSKQHKLTSVNVKNIIHEVITNEHVVAMMKAAINETEAVPPFELKMTRSKFKEVVEKGVVIPTWNISPIKKVSDNKAPQFVDIPLAEEDSSDEEYCPDEEEEDETAEETFQESDMESTASSPRGSRLSRTDEDSCSPWQTSRSKLRRFKVGSMGPPPPPKAPPSKPVTDSTFLEKLHAVEEELADWTGAYQPLSESEDEAGVMACRTRSKRPLRNVPLGQLEAELRAPDITPDMYDSNSAPEDREWTDWLRGLMTSDVDNEEECDDEDDPEYNFLADTDEPDLEDYRDDRAVRITKKEVNELMEELFETLKEDLTRTEADDEGHDEEEEPLEESQHAQTQTPQEHHIKQTDHKTHNEPITELRTVKQRLAFIRTRPPTHDPEPCTLKLNVQQKKRLQQQLQQHVQLLTQVNLLTSPVAKLQSEAETTRQFLFELDMLAQRGELVRSEGRPGFRSAFRVSNLQGAMELVEEMRQTPINYQPRQPPADARGQIRNFPAIPAELAWIFATRSMFLHADLLPCVSLDPDLYCPRRTSAFTAPEDCLLVLGLRNMEGSCDPPKLVSQFLLRKTVVQVRRRIIQCCRPCVPDNIVKAFRYQQVVWAMPMASHHVDPAEQRPPVEREDGVLPRWLVHSLPVIRPIIEHFNNPSASTPEAPPSVRRTKARQSHRAFLRSASGSCSLPPGTRYPSRLPDNLDFKRMGFVSLRQPLPPDSAPLSDQPVNSPSFSVTSLKSHGPAQAFRHRLIMTRPDSNANDEASFSLPIKTIERIRVHSKTLASLRRRTSAFPPKPAYFQEMEDDAMRKSDKDEEEEESQLLLALSESSASPQGSVAHDDDDQKNDKSENDCDVTVIPSDENFGKTSSDELRDTFPHLPESHSPEEPEDDEDQRKSDDALFAENYLKRVCETVQANPGCFEQLLQVFDEFSASEAPEVLYDRLSRVLHLWPQLVKDFAAFLTRKQARRCGLLLEQQLFERSRSVLMRLRQSLGERSPLYQELVSLLQKGFSLSSADVEKVLYLLRDNPDLQRAVQDFFQHIQTPLSPVATSSTHICADGAKQSVNTRTENDRRKDEERRAVCAKNITVTSTGEKVVVWTREADRTILTACQQKGANRKTFRQVSTQLGNKTVQQVQLRFHDLIKLFYSASNKSSEVRPISLHTSAPD